MIATEPLAAAGAGFPTAALAAGLRRSNSQGTSSPSKLAPWNMNPALAEFLAGAIAEFTKVSCIYPLDLVRNRMSCSSPGLYRNMGDCFVKTIQGEGIAGLYKGILATYCSNIGKGAIGFGVYGC